ncbi:MAG: carbon storage regulator CsrA [Gammaproteobacteria bacterium]|nr:carbon storage regulator CsrA [Gammaproteobacteria bacterium]
MLVLTRRAGESIMIDDEIELKVLKIRGSQVHLGIDAPKRAAVHRKEVWLRIQEETTDPAPQTVAK